MIVRDLPSTRDWADCLDLAASSEQFSAAVIKRVTAGVSAGQIGARDRLAPEGWSSKAAQFARDALAELPAHIVKESYIS